MRHGRIIETATVARILQQPRDPYTRTLLPPTPAPGATPARGAQRRRTSPR